MNTPNPKLGKKLDKLESEIINLKKELNDK